MSENFQEKDAGEQFEKIIDWNKVKKDFKKTVCVIMVCIACLAGYVTYNTVQENKLKNAVASNPAVATAIVEQVSYEGKNHNYYTYSFKDRIGKFYSKKVSGRHSRHQGDKLCVRYQADKPRNNILCDESEIKEVVGPGLITTLLIITFLSFIFAGIKIGWRMMWKHSSVLKD